MGQIVGAIVGEDLCGIIIGKLDGLLNPKGVSSKLIYGTILFVCLWCKYWCRFFVGKSNGIFKDL